RRAASPRSRPSATRASSARWARARPPRARPSSSSRTSPWTSTPPSRRPRARRARRASAAPPKVSTPSRVMRGGAPRRPRKPPRRRPPPARLAAAAEARRRWAARQGSHAPVEHKARAIVASYSIDGPRERFVRDPEEAVTAARDFGYPVVLKAMLAGVVHKTEHGLVRVG